MSVAYHLEESDWVYQACRAVAHERGQTWEALDRREQDELAREVEAAFNVIDDDELHDGCVPAEFHGDGKCVPFDEGDYERGFDDACDRIIQGLTKATDAGTLATKQRDFLIGKIRALEPAGRGTPS